MAKGNKDNGTLKLILALIAVGGFLIAVGGLIWKASTINSVLAANCSEDKRVHPIAEDSQDTIIGMGKDIDQIQKDVSRINKTQDSIDKKLDDLFMMQMAGPGSNSQ